MLFISRIGCAAALLAVVGASMADAPPQQRLQALAEQLDLRFGDHPPALDARLEALRSLVEAWNEADNSAEAGRRDAAAVARNEALLDDWLERAFEASLPGGSGGLPPAPSFESILAPEPLPEPVTRQPDRVTRESPASLPALPPAATPTPGDATVVLEPTPNAVESSILPQPAREPQRAVAEVAPAPSPERRRVARPVIERPVIEPAARSKWSRRPASAPLEWSDPFEDDPSASPNPLRAGALPSGLSGAVYRPRFRPAAASRLDLTQLTADVRGYNAALRQLQVALLAGDADDAAGLVEAANELERLEQKRSFLDLYREGLAAPQREALPVSPSAELVRELVRRRAERLLTDSNMTTRRERDRLRSIRERLAQAS